MYDREETRLETNLFWSLIADQDPLAPRSLCRDRDLWDVWQSDNLYLSQTCGMPFRYKLHDKVHYVCTPDFGLENCPPGYYYSVFLKRCDDNRDLNDLSQGPYAFNERLSQSGWAGPVVHLEGQGLTVRHFVHSQAHRSSAKLVQEKRADFCAIDAHTWRLMQTYDTWAKDLEVIETTHPTPGLPYICGMSHDPIKLESQVLEAFEKLPILAREKLGICGFVSIDVDQYLSVPNPSLPYET